MKTMFALITVLMASSAYAGDCYMVKVSGCGKTAKVCVATSSSTEADSKAVGAFKSAYACSSAHVDSSRSSCAEAANDKCDLRQ